MAKIIRTICYFSSTVSDKTVEKLNAVAGILSNNSYEIQTKRICSKDVDIKGLGQKITDKSIFLSIGSLNNKNINDYIDEFLSTDRNIALNLDITKETISDKETNLLFEIIKTNPAKTFNFAFVFNNKPSTPFFPSASYEKDGFSIGLQPTSLSENCNSLEEWFIQMEKAWNEIYNLFKNDQEFLGIDSSIAPLYTNGSSFINFIKKIGYTFNDSVTTDIYTKITKFIKEKNPRPIGLCGLMLPCLEDFELADEYENGDFNIERNIFLSLHSGLGIDTYPIAIDQDIKKVTEILKLVQALSNKYQKPLSIRFVSDGKSKIGERTDFKNQYLKDVKIQKL